MNTNASAPTNSLERSEFSATWSAATDVGKKRAVNEDSHLAADGMWVIADGMGGHAAGKLASETAIQAFADRAGDIPLELSEVPELLDVANQRVRAVGRENGHEVMGTTISGVVLVDNGGEDALLLFNVGDSRCYEVDETEGLVQRTVDHSYVQELVDRGEISADEARTHPDRNVVSRAVGLEDAISADFWILPQSASSRFLLCSDGLTNELDETFIADILLDEDDPQAASALLMESVAETPARDNTTLIVLDASWVAAEQDDTSDDGLGTTVERNLEQGNVSEPDPLSTADLIDSVPGRVAEPDARVESSELVVDGVPADLPGGKVVEE